jgi:ribosomal protein S18 acetylase RimI-like enzyme
MNTIRLADERDYLVWREGSGGTVEILDIAVGSGRRQGRGRRLVGLLADKVPEGTLIWAITRADNAVAQQFYESLRFRVVGVLRSFYTTDLTAKDSVDAIMYGRNTGSQA